MPRRKASFGALPTGAKVLSIKLPPPEMDVPRPEGTVICAGIIPGRAVPWKSAEHDGRGRVIMNRGYKSYVAWLQHVAIHARQLMGRKRPYGGFVRLDVTFYLRGGGNVPDRTNLLKAYEDSLQGIVYVNDRQVVSGETGRVVSMDQKQRVEFRVSAV